MENSGRATELGGDGQKMGNVRGKIQDLASKRCVLTEEVFGGTETPDGREITP